MKMTASFASRALQATVFVAIANMILPLWSESGPKPYSFDCQFGYQIIICEGAFCIQQSLKETEKFGIEYLSREIAMDLCS